ncbi:glycosyltransferase [Candidatus Bathyarchaeota archaeon]|nr:glycosyltransferase [Candidatus Bathyarchaeota archaeon]
MIVACIPAFNEEKTMARVVLVAQRYVDRVVACDDGSKDMTTEIVERLGADVVRHEGESWLKCGGSGFLFRRMRVF